MPLPKIRCFTIDGIDDQCTPADQAGRRYATLQRMLEQSGANSSSVIVLIRRELPQQQAGNWIGRLACTDRPRQRRGKNGRRRKAVIADDPVGLMHDHDGGKTLLLIG